MKYLFFRDTGVNGVVLPSDFNPYSNVFGAIAGGGGPSDLTLAGSGGGECAISVNVPLAAGAFFFVSIGKVGLPNQDGGDTIIGTPSNPILRAKGGKCDTNGSGGDGGTSGFGDTLYHGGKGAPDQSTKQTHIAGGGGGGAGPQGEGQNGDGRYGGEPGLGTWNDGHLTIGPGDGGTGGTYPGTPASDGASFGAGSSGRYTGAYGKGTDGVFVIGYDPIV